jgi:formate hydrogenlyase subunit 3/multisubunit Na+/H+ antiporter MnhD subunit
MIDAVADAGHPEVAAIILLGSVIAVFYYTRVARLLFFHPYDGPVVTEAPAAMLTALGVLTAALIFGGVLPNFQIDLVRPVADLMASRNGFAPAVIPNLVIAWPAAAAIATVGAAAVWLVGRRSVAWSGRLAVAVLLVALVVVLAQPGHYDRISYWYAALVAAVGAANMLYTTGYLAHSHAQPRFYSSFGLMMAGLIGMAGSSDAFNFFAFWELMSSWTLYVAIIHDETDDARREGFKYFIFNSVGACFMFLGIGMLGSAAGTFDFVAMGRAALAMPVGWAGSALVLMFLGMVMKAAQLPVRIDYQMHPAEAPTPASAYISSVLLECGPYGVLRLSTLLGGALLFGRLGFVFHMPVLLYVISVIGGITIFYAGAMAVIQTGMKRLLIYSTVCQLGYMTMAVALGTPLGVAGGLMHVANHMMLKDTLFLVAGCIMAQSHATNLNQLGGLGRRMPITFGIFLFAGLSLAGVPPLNGFNSKWLIYQAAFQSGHYLLGLSALISSLFTLAAILKFAHTAFMGPPSAEAQHAHEAPASMLVPLGVLTAASVVFSVMPGLLLVPIAAIEAQLGMVPIVASWTGPLPGTGGWQPAVLWVLLVVFGVVTWFYLRAGRQGVGVVQTHMHECGVGDLPPVLTRVNASNLFETPEHMIRLVFQGKRVH